MTSKCISLSQQYTIPELTAHVEKEIGCSLDEYAFSFRGQPVEAVRHGRQLTLKDCSIKTKSTLILMKVGFVLNITNPEVSHMIYNDS